MLLDWYENCLPIQYHKEAWTLPRRCWVSSSVWLLSWQLFFSSPWDICSIRLFISLRGSEVRHQSIRASKATAPIQTCLYFISVLNSASFLKFMTSVSWSFYSSHKVVKLCYFMTPSSRGILSAPHDLALFLLLWKLLFKPDFLRSNWLCLSMQHWTQLLILLAGV